MRVRIRSLSWIVFVCLWAFVWAMLCFLFDLGCCLLFLFFFFKFRFILFLFFKSRKQLDRPDFYKLSRTFIFLVGQGLDPLVIELGNNHLVGWALCRHKLLLTYNAFFSLEFTVLIALDFDYACSFLAYQGK